MNLGTRNTTYKMGGRPAGARNALKNEMCKSFVRRNVAEEHT